MDRRNVLLILTLFILVMTTLVFGSVFSETGNAHPIQKMFIEEAINPLPGQYANYSNVKYYSNGTIDWFGWANYSYLNYALPDVMNLTLLMERPDSLAGTYWALLNIASRWISDSTVPEWTNSWYAYWIEENVTIGSTINFFKTNATVIAEERRLLFGKAIKCWVVNYTETGFEMLALYDKKTGMFVEGTSKFDEQFLMNLTLVSTDVPIGLQSLSVHNLDTHLNYTSIQEAIDAPETLDGHTIFVDKGVYYEHLVVKKSLSLIGERSSITIINGSGAYATIVHVIADNVSIGGFTIRNGQDYPGIYVENSSHCVIKGNTFIDINYYAIYTVNADYSLIEANNFSSSSGNWGRGIQLRYSDNSTIIGNQIMTHNDQYCIWLHNSSDCNIYDDWLADAEDGLMIEHSYGCLVKKNVIENCGRGIDIGWWVGGEFVENLIKSNYYGVDGEGFLPQYPQYPKWIFYHNNFINNTHKAYVSSGEGSWNNTVEGNYWDDYSGVDSNYDGIGDSPYSIEHAPNKDNHPLIGMFHSFNTSLGYHVNIVCNSTIESFQYFESNRTIRMHVSNMTANQTFGFCRVCIPYTLMDVSNITVTIDNGLTDVLHFNDTIYDNGTHRWIYFAYPHSIHEIDVIPEFPSFLILPLFIIATLLAVIVYRRKHVQHHSFSSELISTKLITLKVPSHAYGCKRKMTQKRNVVLYLDKELV